MAELSELSLPDMADDPSWRKFNILVLEDNPFQRTALTAMLRSAGCSNVYAAADGKQALAAMAVTNMDIVFCDLQNLDPFAMDGIEFIRLASWWPIGSLVLISALDADLFSAAEMLAAGYRVPLAGCLPKPIRPNALREVLERCRPFRADAAEKPIIPNQVECTPKELWQALRKGQFVPYFQPKVDLASGKIVAAEVLARWNHPASGILPPSCFIPCMEREGGLDELTEQLYRKALEVSRTLSLDGTTLQLAINASPRTLQDVRIPNRWRAIAAEHGVAAENITFEITETAIAEDFHGLLETVTRLRMHGFGVSLDDFGTSFSSLQQLSELPITEVKIDRSFVLHAPIKERAAHILEAIVALAHKLGLKSVAEGIESQEDVELVRAAGCDQGQGYYFSKPVAADGLLALLSHGQTR